MKKLIYLLLTLPLFLCLNVKAWTLGQPYVNYMFDDGTFPSGAYGTEQVMYNTSYYTSPFLLGGVSLQQYVKSVYFSYYNTGFCAGQDISVSGTIASEGYNNTNKLFNDESTSIVVKNNNQVLSCVLNNLDGNRTYYQCYGQGGGDFSIEVSLNSYHTPAQYRVGISKDISITCDASNLDVISNATANTNAIINNQNGNTQVIINNQNSNTQDIIDNQDSNTQDIIDNQNQNTQQQIESQYVCKSSLNYSLIPNLTLNNSNGTTSSASSTSTSDYIKIPNLIKITGVSGNSNRRICFYTQDKTFISCSSTANLPVDTIINIPSSAYFLRYNVSSSNNLPNFSFCYNGNQALTDSITSEDAPNTSGELEDLDSSIASDTPISDLILLPITLLNTFINGINSSCSPVNLGSLYGTDLILPCINIEQRIGSNLWSMIDILFSIFMCYNIGMLFISAFSGITSLRDDFDSMYQPKHADTGYQPKHGG